MRGRKEEVCVCVCVYFGLIASNTSALITSIYFSFSGARDAAPYVIPIAETTPVLAGVMRKVGGIYSLM